MSISCFARQKATPAMPQIMRHLGFYAFVLMGLLLLLLPSLAQAQTIELTLWHAYRGEERSALEKVVQAYESVNPGTKVSVLAVPDESFANKVFSATPRGSGPDVFISAHDVIGNWADNKIIADLSDDFSPEERAAFHPTTIQALQYKGGIYAIPLAYKSVVLFYNKDKIAVPPKDTDTLMQMLQAQTNLEKQEYALVYVNTDLYFHSPWLNGFGGSLFDENDNVRVNTEANAKSFEFARKLKNYLPTGVDGARIKSLFNDGTANMVINGPWFMAELKKDLNYGVATLPFINETGAYAAPFVTAEGIYLAHETDASLDNKDPQFIAEKVARRAAAIKLMKYVATEGAYTRAINGRQMVAYTAAYEQLKTDNSPEAAFMRSVAPVFLAQLDHAVPTSNRPEMGSLWATMQQALQKSLYGGPSGETPYLLFLLMCLIIGGIFLATKATNPSLSSPEKHKLFVGGSILSFLLCIPVIAWVVSVQGSKRQIDPLLSLTEAQSRFSMLKAPAAEPSNPGPFMLGLAFILLLACLWGLYAYKQHLKKNIEYTDNKTALIFVSPAILGMILLVFFPFVVGAGLSFFSYQNGEFVFVGFQNFIRLFSSEQSSFLDSLSIYFTFVVTILWTVTNVALHVTFGLILALLLREPWLKLKGFYRVLLIVPWAMPNYITALIWRGMFDTSFGAINGILSSLGFNRVEWFNEFLTSFAANLITNTWLGFPFMMVVTLGALQSIPRDLEDAAAVDGASAFQRFRHVTFPLLKPALMPSVVLGSIWTFNAFNIIYLVSSGNPDGSTEILVSEAYKWAFERQYQYGYAAAYAMVVFAILVLYSKLTQYVLEDKNQ